MTHRRARPSPESEAWRSTRNHELSACVLVTNMATPRVPWDDDSDSDFQSAASFELDGPDDDKDLDEFVVEASSPGEALPETQVHDDFQECVDGLLLDEGYFGSDAYRGPPGVWSSDIVDWKRRGRTGVTPRYEHDDDVAVDLIGESDLARVVNDTKRGDNETVRSHRPNSSAFVRDAMSRAAADSLLRGVMGGDESDDEFFAAAMAKETPVRPPVDDLRRAPPTDREAMLRDSRERVQANSHDQNDTHVRNAPNGTSTSNLSDDDDDLITEINNWEEDFGVKNRRAIERNNRRRINYSAPSSDDEDVKESKKREAREERLKLLELEVLERQQRAQFDAARLAVQDVVRSDREMFIAEQSRDAGNATSLSRNSFPQGNYSYGGGGGGEGGYLNTLKTQSGTFDDLIVVELKRTRERDRSPGRARRGGGVVSHENSRVLFQSDISEKVSPTQSGSPGSSRQVRGDISRSPIDVVTVRIQRRERTPAPTTELDPAIDPYRAYSENSKRIGKEKFKNKCCRDGNVDSVSDPNTDKTSRGWRSVPEESTEEAWRNVLPGVVVPDQGRRRERGRFGRRKGGEVAKAAYVDGGTKSTTVQKSPVPPEVVPEVVQGTSVAPASALDISERPTTAVSGRHPDPSRPIAPTCDRPKHRAAGGLGAGSRRGGAAMAADPDAHKFPMHAAAFYGDLDALRRAIFDALAEPRVGAEGSANNAHNLDSDAPHPSLTRLDTCGNTAAHVAVLRNNINALDLILNDSVCGFPVDARSSHGWSLIQEATHLRNKKIVKKLVTKSLDRQKTNSHRKSKKMVAALRNVPDMTMQMRWEFGSNVFGPVVRAYAPSDTYDISKKGVNVRVDGTLRGIDEERDEHGNSKNMLPKWKRGKFSVLFQGNDEGLGGVGPEGNSPKDKNHNLDDSKNPNDKNPKDSNPAARMWYLDHEKKQAVDMSDDGDTSGIDGFSETELIDAEVDSLMTRGPVKEKYQTGDISFKPVKSWLVGDRVETIGPWKAAVWEATGLVAKKRVTRAGIFYSSGTFGEYLESFKKGNEDIVEQKDAGVVPEEEENPKETLKPGKGPSEQEKTKETEEKGVDDDSDSDASDESLEPNEDASSSAHVSAPTLSPSGGNMGGGVVSSQKTPQKPSRPLTQREQRWARRAAKREKAPPKPRKVSARCWLADGFPVSVEALNPILDIASRANKHLKKAKAVFAYWEKEQSGRFPVKVTVPIIMTVFATIQFLNFREMADGVFGKSTNEKDDTTSGTSSSYFEIPDGYVRKTLVQALREAEAEERAQLEREAKARRAAHLEERKQKELKALKNSKK